MSTPRPQLRAGTCIEVAQVQATVVRDAGGPSITVECAGHVQDWRVDPHDASFKVLSVPRGALSYGSFEEYVADFPEGERFRAWLTRYNRPCVLIRLVDADVYGGVPGGYLWLTWSAGPTGLRLCAQDHDDGLLVRDFPADAQAELDAVVAQMREFAPLSMTDPKSCFEFRWE